MVTTAGLALAFDVGGTRTRASLVNTHTGRVESHAEGLTPNYLTHDLPAEVILELVLTQMSQLGNSLLASKDAPKLVTVGYAGPINDDGVAVRSPTILGEQMDRPFELRERLIEIWSPAEVYVLNDLTAAGYYFVEKGESDFCVVTVGSGIGNKIFLKGEPVVGERRLGGEIGHLIIPQLADELGRVSSGRAAQSYCEESGSDFPSDVVELIRGFKEGHPESTDIVDRLASPLAWTLASIHLACGIDRFFIVGGLAKSLGNAYRDQLLNHMRSLVWDVGQDWERLIEMGPQDQEEAIAGGVFFAGLIGGC